MRKLRLWKKASLAAVLIVCTLPAPVKGQTITVGNTANWNGLTGPGSNLGLEWAYSQKVVYGFLPDGTPLANYTWNPLAFQFSAPIGATQLNSFSLWLGRDLSVYLNRAFISLERVVGSSFLPIGGVTQVNPSQLMLNGPLFPNARYDFDVGGVAVSPGDIFRVFLDAGDPRAPGFPSVVYDAVVVYAQTVNNEVMYEAVFTAAPEPATIALLGTGLLGIGLVGWRRKRA